MHKQHHSYPYSSICIGIGLIDELIDIEILIILYNNKQKIKLVSEYITYENI